MTKKYIPVRNEKNRTVSISMPKAVHAAVLELAEKEGRSFSNMITQICKEMLAKTQSSVDPD